jgi:uncharacterized RDD family membrane protein YckC
MTVTCTSCGSEAEYRRGDQELCEACYERNVASWSRRDSDRIGAPSVEPVSQAPSDQIGAPSMEPVPQAPFATLPRRLNALTADSVILIGFSAAVIMFQPAVEGIVVLRLVWAAVWWGTLIFYEPVMVALLGGTLGHRALNLRVVDDRTGGNPSLSKAIGRLPLKVLLGGFSFLFMSFTNRHQALHDLVTSTTVQIRNISKAKPHHFVWGPPPSPPTVAA